MSGLEIFSAITGLLQLTDATYKVIKNYRDLPTEFKEVGERLPIAQRTLSVIEAQAQNAQIDAATLATIQPLLDGCQMKTKELQSIFDKVRKWEGKSIRAKYHKFLVSATGKGKQVEKLMMAVLKDVQTLAADRMFETATAVQMEELKKAIEDMAALQPDEPEGSGGSQNIHGNITGGKLFYQQGSGTIQAPDGDIVGRDKIVVHFKAENSEACTLEEADAWIRHKIYTNERLAIIRLSGDHLPIEQCYINLAIVEALGEQADRSKGKSKNGSEGDAAPQSSPFSLSARLKVETPSEKLLVKLPLLFDSRQGADSKTKTPRRILIRGRAGVGKTTLCKKIVFDFIRGHIWNALFTRVLWVPLRNLKLNERRQESRYNFGNLFRDEYFSQHPRADDLAKALWDGLPRAKNGRSRDGRTLFLLDGLDEVQDLDTGSSMSRFLEELLNQPNLIITTRPHVTYPAGLQKPDHELETIGFFPEQVQDYLKKTVDKQQFKEIQLFLQKRRLIQDLIRIPILLDALCFAWAEDDFGASTIPETMTTIYEAIVQRLWKKDAQRLGNNVEDAQPSEIKDLMMNEENLLGCLAFSGLCSNVIEFQPAHRNAAAKYLKPGNANFFFDGRLQSLSFLRTSDPIANKRSRSYHFLHLTFQEYFAAQYFVQQWETGQELEYLDFKRPKRAKIKIDPRSFFQKQKYTARYNIVWRFAAGLLKDEAKCIFNEIEKEPLDFLGPTHQRLVMHCLSEVDSSTELPGRKSLEAKLSQWLLFECSFRGYSLLAREEEYPEQALRTALKTGSGKERKEILFIARSRIHLSATTVEAIAALLKDDDRNVRFAAADVLGGQSSLSATTVEAITALFKDDDTSVRSAAARALKGQSSLSATTIEAIAALLKDNDISVRSAATRTLGGQSSLLATTAEAIAALLKDNNRDVRFAAANALRRQSSLSATAVETIAALLKDNNRDVRFAAADVLRRQSSLLATTVEDIVALLKDNDRGVRSAAAHILGNQSSLIATTVEAIAALLKDDNRDVRFAAAEALVGQSSLSAKLLEAMPPFLKSEGPVEAANSTLLNVRFMESLYGILLRHSFEEQLTWYILCDHGRSSYVINMQGGLIEVPLRGDSQNEHFLTIVNQARQSLGSPRGVGYPATILTLV